MIWIEVRGVSPAGGNLSCALKHSMLLKCYDFKINYSLSRIGEVRSDDNQLSTETEVLTVSHQPGEPL